MSKLSQAKLHSIWKTVLLKGIVFFKEKTNFLDHIWKRMEKMRSKIGKI